MQSIKELEIKILKNQQLVNDCYWISRRQLHVLMLCARLYDELNRKLSNKRRKFKALSTTSKEEE